MHKQSGSLLLEYMVVAVLITLTAVWAVDHMQRQMREQLLIASINWSLQLREAVQDYLHALHTARTKQSDWFLSWPYIDWRHPRLDELQNQGLVSKAFPLRTALGEMQVHVFETLPCEQPTCRVDALLFMAPSQSAAWLTQPYYQTLWKLQSQGYGVTVSGSGANWSGPGGKWDNPLYATSFVSPMGSVGVSVFKTDRRSEDFLRVGDARDPNFSGSLTVRESITSHQDLHAKGALRIDGQARYKAPCDTEKAVLRDSVDAALLMCQNGYWRLLGGGYGGAYSQHTSYACHTGPAELSQANPVTGACDCPPDYVALLMVENFLRGGLRRSYLCMR